MTKKPLSRRLLVAGAPLALAMPALAAAPQAETPIARLWAEAETLKTRLAGHRAAIAEASQAGGIPGWMRLSGEANTLAEARYSKLVAILRTEARTRGDVAILARVSRDEDILAGPRAWAAERLAEASLTLAA